MGLTTEERISIIEFRLEKAKKTISELPVLAENALWHTAANRLYYACFYAVTALLINDGHKAQTHSGVKSVFGLYYVKTGIIDIAMKDLYLELFELRQTGDYDDMITIKEADVKPLIAPAEKFIATIEKLIKS
jgi:uncharacterized protein (UPF0332 family)